MLIEEVLDQKGRMSLRIESGLSVEDAIKHMG